MIEFKGGVFRTWGNLTGRPWIRLRGPFDIPRGQLMEWVIRLEARTGDDVVRTVELMNHQS
jgi:hypothetical protein